jgi:poly(3-hydroxybutyrate) depolymerase
MNRPAYAAQNAPVGDQRGVFSVVGLKRTYLLHVPPTYIGQIAVPLVIVLHGTSNAERMLRRSRALARLRIGRDLSSFILISLTLDKTYRW